MCKSWLSKIRVCFCLCEKKRINPRPKNRLFFTKVMKFLKKNQNLSYIFGHLLSSDLALQLHTKK